MDWQKQKQKQKQKQFGHNLFDELPEDVKINLFGRIPLKFAGTVAVVSKSWFHLITKYCFPKSTSSLSYAGLTVRTSNGFTHWFSDGFGIVSASTSTSKDNTLPVPGPGPGDYLDCCNGLLLFSNEDSEEPDQAYSVLDLSTLRWVSVSCPASNLITDPSFHAYASLAYDPSESCFFRIVLCHDDGFGVASRLSVYSSESKSWKALEYWLEYSVGVAEWAEQSVFLRGAMYRLSKSGHLLRFVVDGEVAREDQAVAIPLPCLDALGYCPESACIGLSNGQINFMAFNEEDLVLSIWVLELTNDYHTSTYQWSLRRRIANIYEKFNADSIFFKALSFHPYNDIVFVAANSAKLGIKFVLINFSKDNSKKNSHGKDDHEFTCRNLADALDCAWHDIISFPLLRCPVPFANGFAGNIATELIDGKSNSNFKAYH